jgi:hypothetical protein
MYDNIVIIFLLGILVNDFLKLKIRSEKFVKLFAREYQRSQVSQIDILHIFIMYFNW